MNEQDRTNAMLSCRFCPMCHHVDLATTITRRETYSPRGRGLTLFAIEKGKLEWDDSVADVMYKFTADGLSRQVCAGHINHDDLVLDARRRLVEAGVAPAPVARVKGNIEKTGNPWGESEDLRALVGAEPRKGAELLVYFGPAARVRRPDAVRAMVGLLKAAGVSFTYLPDEGDPGLLLYQLGEKPDGTLKQKIEKAGARDVVTPDADAYRVFTQGFGDVAPVAPNAKHAAALLDELARAGKLKFKAPAKKIAYHDPCALARFAPCIDPPRSLLRAISDRPPLELAWNRERAECSGECGGLPFTNPEIARAGAERRARQAREAGAELLVTSSPAAAHALSDKIDAKDITEFAFECLI